MGEGSEGARAQFSFSAGPRAASSGLVFSDAPLAEICFKLNIFSVKSWTERHCRRIHSGQLTNFATKKGQNEATFYHKFAKS